VKSRINGSQYLIVNGCIITDQNKWNGMHASFETGLFFEVPISRYHVVPKKLVLVGILKDIIGNNNVSNHHVQSSCFFVRMPSIADLTIYVCITLCCTRVYIGNVFLLINKYDDLDELDCTHNR
jgi:hypothetical protein